MAQHDTSGLVPAMPRDARPSRDLPEVRSEHEGRKSLLAGLRFHNLPHHAITELAASQPSDSTIMAPAGHVSGKMLEHYSHVRQDAKRDAVNLLSAKYPEKPTPERLRHKQRHKGRPNKAGTFVCC